MEHFGTNGRKIAILAAISAAAVVSGCSTAGQNMAKQTKLHVIPGKQLQATGPNYEFCEVALVYGSLMEKTVANFYNPTGIGHCSPEQFAQIAKDKEQIIKQTGAKDAFLHPSRHWTWDEFWGYEVGEERQFGPIKMVYVGVVPVDAIKQAAGAGHYQPAPISRNYKYLFKKGTQVYLLDTPDGKAFVMQSWSNVVNKGEMASNLWNLGTQLKQLPPGWKYRTRVLDRDLTVQPPAPTHLAWLLQDEFQNTYQGCGYDAACNYVP